MAITEVITDKYAIYQGDCIEKIPSIPDSSIHLSVYSPPFDNLYAYSSSDHDLGNCKTYEEFLIHYEYLIKEMARVTMPGRMNCVHCMDIPKKANTGLNDFPGDIIRLHEKNGFYYWDRHNVWKEPLRVAIRTRSRSLMHQQLCNDSSLCRGATADYVLVFKRKGENTIPVKHPIGLTTYAGDIELMNKEDHDEFLYLRTKYTNHKDDKTNRLSQFIWRRYASSAWVDVRANIMLEYKPARDKEDERHVCPLHLDIIERCIMLWSNEGEKVLTPFMGIGSEVFGAVKLNRKGIGIELKESYFNQAVKNLAELKHLAIEQTTIFQTMDEDLDIDIEVGCLRD